MVILQIWKTACKNIQREVRSTKSRAPFIVYYHEVFATKSEAYKQELFFKSAQGKIYLKGNEII